MPKLLLEIQENRRRLDLESDFFVSGNFERFKSFAKLVQAGAFLQENEELNYINQQLPAHQIVCAEAGCSQGFSSVKRYEEHKFKCHGHQCSICKKSFPADRLLSLHISELHDSYFAVSSKKKPLYCCLVERCDGLFWSDSERRKHLIDTHLFHPSYDFHNPRKYMSKFTREKLPIAKNESSSSGSGAQTVQPLNRAQRRAAKSNTSNDNVPNVEGIMDVAATPSSLSQSTNTVRRENVPVPVPTRSLRGEARSNKEISKPTSESSMDVDADLEAITDTLRTTKINVPSKISFGRRHNK